MYSMILRLAVLAPILALPGMVAAQSAAPTPAASAQSLEKEKLDIQRLQLENEKLKLEVEKMKLAATAVPTPSQAAPTPTPKSGDAAKEALLKFEQAYSDKAKDLAKSHAAEADLVVLDFVNAEVWYKGIRYGVYELPALAAEQGLPVKKGLDERLPNGVPRWRYRVANLTLWKYESRDKGILEAAAPQDAGDFRVLTPEGVSFGSDSGEVRDACENAYFKYDGVGENGKYRILKYTHGEGLAFADKLEFWMDRDGKMQKIRFGTLDEH